MTPMRVSVTSETLSCRRGEVLFEPLCGKSVRTRMPHKLRTCLPPNHFLCCALRHPQPPTGGFGPFGPEVSGECPRECPRKSGCPRECPGDTPRGPFGPRAPECPKGVPRVSPECPDTFLTLRRHSRDTFWTHWGPGPEGPPRHSPGHSLRHPRFSGTLSWTLPGTLRARSLL